MKKQNLIFSALTTTAMAGLLTFASAAQAGPNCDHKGGKGGHAKHSQMSDADKAAHMEKRLNRMATKLGLSDEQKTKVQALKLTGKNEIKPLRDESRALRTEIRGLDSSATDYAAKLADAANRQAEITRQLIVAKGTQHQQMATILTTEQLAQMKEMRTNRKGGKRGGKRHHRKHGNKQES